MIAKLADRRLSLVELDSQKLWVKRYDIADRAGYALLHRLSALLPLPNHIKPSPKVDSHGAVERQLRKSKAFLGARIPVPSIAFANSKLIVSRHAGQTALAKLDDLKLHGDRVGHGELLARTMRLLAKLHSKGLCHGRPHLRDIFITGEDLGVMDFDEEPEAVMPLAMAQARDVWLMSLSVADLAIEPSASEEALIQYRTNAPKETLDALDELMRFWHPLVSSISWTRHIKEGADLRRLIKADRLLTGTA